MKIYLVTASENREALEALSRRFSGVRLDGIFCAPVKDQLLTANAVKKTADFDGQTQLIRDLAEAGIEGCKFLSDREAAEIFTAGELAPTEDPTPTGGPLEFDRFEAVDLQYKRIRAARVEDYLLKRSERRPEEYLVVTGCRFASESLMNALMHSFPTTPHHISIYNCPEASVTVVDITVGGIGVSTLELLGDLSHLSK